MSEISCTLPEKDPAMDDIKHMRDSAESEMARLFSSISPGMKRRITRSYIRYWTKSNDNAACVLGRLQRYILNGRTGE